MLSFKGSDQGIFFGKVVICCYSESFDYICGSLLQKKFVVPERGFLILFPQSLSPLAETVVYFFKVSS